MTDNSASLRRARRHDSRTKRQLAADDQLFQKLIRDQFMLGRILAHRQRDFERRNMPKMEIRTEPGGGLCGGFTAELRIAPEVMLEEMAEPAFGFITAAVNLR